MSVKQVNRFLFSTAVVALIHVGQSQATIIVDNTGASPECDTSLVTLADTAPPTGDFADACIGYVPKLGSTTAETEFLNARTDGGNWSFVYKVSEDETEGSGAFQGINIELTAVDLGDTDGNWSISWWDANGDALPNLPLVIDIAAAFKAGTNIAYFLFEQVLLSAPSVQGQTVTRLGTFDLQVRNGLSHESLFIRLAEESEVPPQEEVPVPGTLWLLMAPIVGTAFRRHLHRPT